MKNRVHAPAKVKTLQEICETGGITYPIAHPIDQDGQHIWIEHNPLLNQTIMRNHPKRSYTVKTSDPRKIVELLAYEAHEWIAYEILRSINTYKFPLLT
jgi:hypothetical protein